MLYDAAIVTTMPPSNGPPAAAEQGNDDSIPNSDDSFQRTQSSPPNGASKSPTKSLDRSISAPSASSSPAYSSDRALNTIKHIAAGVRRKGRHLRIKSDSTPPQIPSLPLISPQGASSSTSPTSHHPLIHQQHPQHLLFNSFSQQLAVSAPPHCAPPKPPPSSLQSHSTAELNTQDSQTRRRPSFRHENYPRRPIMQSPHDTIPNSVSPSQPTSLMDPNVGSDLLDVKVPALLQQGTPMLKVSTQKIKSRMVRLDADLGQIQWQSKKSGVGKSTHLCSAYYC